MKQLAQKWLWGDAEKQNDIGFTSVSGIWNYYKRLSSFNHTKVTAAATFTSNVNATVNTRRLSH